MTTETIASEPITSEDDAIDLDTPWKQALKFYFRFFIEFCFPEIAEQLDWARPHEFLDKELKRIMRNTDIGHRIADLLVKVYKKDGSETWILLHIEIQGQKEDIFPKRMFIYYYRAWDLYSVPILSIAILTDTNANWRPKYYKQMCFGSGIQMKFHSVKLLDYKKRRQELEKSTNPFAFVILAHLSAQETRKKETTRLCFRITFTRELYKRGLDRKEIGVLMELLEFLMTLPEPLMVEYDKEVATLEQEKRMSYAARMKQQGMQQGMQQGEATLLIRQLKYRFGDIPVPYLIQIQQAPDELLLCWGEKLLDAQSIEEIFS